ncbi:pro-sigmaK processing inhibitor BofA family protein [Paenibacillus sp. GCM10027626]|uniref:pro-sigmaK processing inhibitor BofA family protein n=1 Tax=Paenibacillus sp. GCM10027626 TaxID=3273411 RepID=UPI003630ABF7
MNLFWLACLVISTLLLTVVLYRQRASRLWIKHFALQLIGVVLGIYLLNFSGIISGFEIPLNPLTIGTVILLGLPGMGLIIGLQLVLV